MIAEVAVEPPHAVLPDLPEVGEKALGEMVEILKSARNPVIVTEEAGRDTAAVDALVALAETLGSPVYEAWQPYYVNFPYQHPLYGGVVVDDMPATLASADVVLLVESVLPWHPPSKIVDKKVLVLGEDPLHPRLPFWGFRADVIGAGNVTNALRQLAKRLPKRTAQTVSRKAMQKPAMPAVIDNDWVAYQLAEALPANAILVNETITHRLDIHKRMEKLAPGSFFEASYGGLGVGLGLALGAKYAHRNRPVVCTIGDGAFHYNPVVGSFGAAQEHGLAILVVLFNNSGYLSQKRDVSNYYPQGTAAKAGRVIGTPIAPGVNYAKLAEAYGGYGEKVEKPADVAAAIQRGLEAVGKGQLALLDMTLAPI
jgi:acetolactate synthase-1/2/3 large subunit